MSGNITNWEIWKIETTPALKAKAVYYFNGQSVQWGAECRPVKSLFPLA